MSSIDDEEADMNSSCAAVSQILLSLEDSLLNSPHNKLSSPPRSVVDCENVLRNHDSESTVDGASLAMDDNRLVSASPVAANDRDRQVTDTTQRSDIDDCDETQYVEQCCGGRLGLVSLLGLDHTYVSVDQTENSVALSVNNSPSLLDVSKLLQFKSSTNSTTGTTAVTSSAAVDTAAETLMRDVSTELQGQMRPEINELDTCNTVAAVCSVNDSHLTCVCSDDNPHVQLCGSGTSNDLLLAAVSSHSATHYEVMGMSNKGRPSPVAVASHVECTSSLSYAGIQVN